MLAPFRSDLLSEYGFFHREIELIEQVDRRPLQHPAEDKQVLPLTAELLLLVLRHISGQADREQLASQPHKWIDPSRFLLEPDAADAVEDEPLSSFQQFLQSRTDSRPKKRVINGSRLLDSAALTLSKEEWGISPREEEVLELIVHGKTNKEIAGALFISEHTVKNHLSRIFHKMQVTDRSQIIALIYKRILNSERIEI
ncbi:helix-turn-helix transcriptional regulator [Paenibacillus typhae]|nr:helix-turn-helix transcriptional regulator [Paenibacillus typhae]